jgi:glucan phosphoethanolaminetransferase (alkaline phosphatase superfamily)
MATKECRICYDNEISESLIRPCRCNSFIHYSCIERWRQTYPNHSNACEICQYEYVFIETPDYSILTNWYMDYVKDVKNYLSRIIIWFLIFSLQLNCIAGLIYGIDSDKDWARIMGIKNDYNYRAYYGLIFIVWHCICQLYIFIELWRIGCSYFCRYLIYFFYNISLYHAAMCYIVMIFAIIYGITNGGSILVDIPATLFIQSTYIELHVNILSRMNIEKTYSYVEYIPR